MRRLTVRRVRRRVFSRLFINLNSSPKDVVFLAGTGRSGTTWVADLLNYRNEYHYLFEPFHPRKVDVCAVFRPRHYLRPTDRNLALLEAAERVLSGRVRNTWTNHYNQRFLTRRRLIKDIRANLLLKWLHTNFPQVRIILLLRHPFAVASSRLRMRWDTYLNEYVEQEALVEDFLGPFRKELQRADDPFDRHIFAWCVENYVPLRQFARGEVHVAFYEELCTTPLPALERIFSFAGAGLDTGVLSSLPSPSSSVQEDSAILAGRELLTSWQRILTRDQVRRGREILGRFGLDRIYSQDPMPDVEGAYAMLRATPSLQGASSSA